MNKILVFQSQYKTSAKHQEKGQPIMTSFLFMGLNIKGESTGAVEDGGRDWLVILYQHTLLYCQLLKVNCFSLLSNRFDCSVYVCVWPQAGEGGGVGGSFFQC